MKIETIARLLGEQPMAMRPLKLLFVQQTGCEVLFDKSELAMSER